MIGANVLTMGGPGTGKTHSAQTLIKALREVEPDAQMLCVFTEPRWQPLVQTGCEGGIHIAYCPPGTGGWDEMLKRSEDITKLPWEAITKKSDPKKSEYKGFIKLLHTFNNFVCRECGKEFGNVTEQRPYDAIWLDSLTGLNSLAMQMVVGGSVSKSLPQFGAAMESEMQVVNQLCYDTQSWFVMVAHLDKTLDEINGGFVINPNALGNKNNGIIATNFDDAILCEREGSKFSWSNFSKGVDTKPGWLPIADTQEPSFAPMVRRWYEASKGA